MEQFFRVGVITSAHGLKGEMKVFPTTEDTERFRDLKEALIDTGREMLPVTVERVRFFKNMVILKVKGIDRIEDCEIYRGKDLLVDRDHAISLGPDENFIADLIGLQVITDEGETFGTVRDIMKTGANDVYVIRGEDGKEYLFPSTKECIRQVDLEAGTVTVHILEGLLDL